MLRALPSFFLLLPLALLLATGCTRTVLASERFRVPVSSRPAEARAQRECIAACRPLYDEDASAYGACLSRCPGAEVATRASCDPDEPPTETWCYELVQERDVPDPEADEVAVNFFGALLEAIVEGVIDGADDDDDSSHHASGRRHHHHESKRVVRVRTPLRKKPSRM